MGGRVDGIRVYDLVCFHALYLLRAIPGQVQVRCNSHGDRRAGTGGDCSVGGHGGGGIVFQGQGRSYGYSTLGMRYFQRR